MAANKSHGVYDFFIISWVELISIAVAAERIETVGFAGKQAKTFSSASSLELISFRQYSLLAYRLQDLTKLLSIVWSLVVIQNIKTLRGLLSIFLSINS